MYVIVLAEVFSIISFIVYLWTTYETQRLAKAQAVPKLGEALGGSTEEVAKVIEASAKLVDSLTKAGPALLSLLASIVFLAIAAWKTL